MPRLRQEISSHGVQRSQVSKTINESSENLTLLRLNRESEALESLVDNIEKCMNTVINRLKLLFVGVCLFERAYIVSGMSHGDR